MATFKSLGEPEHFSLFFLFLIVDAYYEYQQS